MQSGSKNPPWARSNVNSNMSGMNPQIMDHNAMAISQQGMMPFQQTPNVFNANLMQGQSGMGMAMGGQLPMNSMAQGQMYPGNVVAYPTPRGMNPGMYQNNQSDQSQPNTNEQRVFTGTVTKTHNDFGFVDQNVFYSTSVCAKGVIPKVNDRVLVEATYNANMPFKWNATRVQVLPKTVPNSSHNKPGGGPKTNNYNAVPPPSKKPMPNRRDDRPRREERKRSRSRSPVPPRMRSKSRSPRRDSRRKDSPPRKRPTVHIPSPDRYVVQMPRTALDISSVDVPSLSHRYNNLYIPSDFFHAKVCWGEAFPPQSPFPLNSPCGYHIMNKDVENPQANDAILEPPDADYRFSAKVMLISLPSLETLYQKCGLTKSDEKDKRSNKSYMHPTRLIKFLVGHKDKASDNFAIGGPWSPSFDGPDPENDPTVLVKTAIRTCKALTGIDLTLCTQWYRVVEFHYWRESGDRSRLEVVALFLPDVWSAQLSKEDYQHTLALYEAARDAALNKITDATDDSKINTSELNDSTITIDENDDDEKPVPTHYSKLDMKTIKVDQLRQELRARNQSCKGLRPQLISRLTKLIKAEEEKEKKVDDVMEIEDDDDKTEQKEEKVEKENQTTEESKPEVKEKEKEKEKEKSEKEKEKEKEKSEKEKDKEKEKSEKEKEKSEKELEKEKRDKEREEERKKEKLEKDMQAIKNNYELPSTPHIIVHPSKGAKGGKFNCNVVILSLLLDYRVTDNKEHSFELFVFAELFNEMLQRDFGFYVYKTLYTLPEKVAEIKHKETEKKDEKSEEKSDEKGEGEKDKKDGDKDKKEGDKDRKDRDKKSDKRDDRRDSRKKDGKDSDDERNSTPKKLGVDLPSDPFLLLSLVYFDTRRCGYINKKDLQTLFMSLGLMLSRSQIRCILEKVCVKDVFNYKSLVQAIRDISSGSMQAMQDLPLDSLNAPVTSEVPPQIAELETAIATGNRSLLPVFNRQKEDGSSQATKEVGDSGMITYKSRVIDLPATLTALERGNQQRMKLEAALTEARQVARTMRAAAAQTQAASRNSQNQLNDLQSQLSTAKSRITSLTASSRIFHSALKSIQTKVDAVINIKFEEDDDCVEVVNGPKADKSDKSSKKDSKADSKDAKDKKEVKEEKEIKDEGKGDVKDTKEVKGEAKDVKSEAKEGKKEVKVVKKEKEDVSKDNIEEANMEIDDKE